MRIITSLASAAALFAATAFTQDANLKSTPAARPLAAKGALKTARTSTAADVATAANAFLGTLNATQRATLLQSFNSTNVTKWSNLPVNSTNRIGLRFDALTTAQQTAALAVVQAATGTDANQGYQEVQQIRAADDYLAANGGGAAYGSGVYLIAFLVNNINLTTIGATDTWMLMFGGHHLATNISFGNGYVTGPSPKFEGVEPLSFTSTGGIFPSGTTVAPLNDEEAGMAALFASLTTDQKAAAKLSQTFSDVVLGPGNDGKFPATSVGLRCSQLTSAQQALVVAAMAPWVKDVDDATGTQLLNYYQTQLANTYISYSGTGLFTSNADYARIDGPNAWVEFVCQTGVVFRNNIHYHSIYRDRARDYGGNFYGTYTTALGTKGAAAAAVFSLFPNPAYSGADLQVRLASASAGTYVVRDLLGRQLATGTVQSGAAAVPTTSLAAGTYLLTVETLGQAAVTSRFQVQ